MLQLTKERLEMEEAHRRRNEVVEKRQAELRITEKSAPPPTAPPQRPASASHRDSFQLVHR